jgi:uncharacterized protein (DUF2344 family)
VHERAASHQINSSSEDIKTTATDEFLSFSSESLIEKDKKSGKKFKLKLKLFKFSLKFLLKKGF